MRILLALLLAISAQAQESAFSRIKVVPRGAGVGSIDFYETRANGSKYTRLQSPDDQTADRTITLPSAVSTTLVGQENYVFSTIAGTSIIGYRARGTEASPVNVVGNEVTLGLYGYALHSGVFSAATAIVQSVESVSPLVGRFALYTDNGSGFGERLALGGVGHLTPGVTSTQNLGGPAAFWLNTYTNNLHFKSPSSTAYMSIYPSSFSSSFDMYLPGANASGALTNDGAGNLSWSSAGGTTPPVTWDLDTTSDVLTLGTHVNSSAAQQLVTRFSRGTTASPTTVSNGDQFLQMTFQYYAGTGYKDAAAIFAYVADATPSNDSYGGRLSFFTSNSCTVSCSGGNPADEKLRIDTRLTAMTSLVPSANNTYALGSATEEWATAYARILSSSTTLTLIADGAPEWTITSARLSPQSDAGSSIGSSTIKPDEVWARTFRAVTASGYGTQDHSFFADQNSANLNLYTYGNSGSSMPRGGFHAYTAGGTYSLPSAIGNGARMGVLAMHGFSSGSYNNSVSIEGWVNGTVSGSTVPGELRFLTMNTSGTLANRWLISPAGTFLPGATATYDIGASGTRVNKIYTTDFDVSGTCTGCGSTTPPVTWDLDSSTTVATLGNHGTVTGNQIVGRFSRGTTASPTDTVDTDQVFSLKVQYYASGAYRDAAAILAYATATPSSTSSPGKLSFFVTPTGTTSGVERFYIDDTESWFRSSMPGDHPLHIQNTSSSGFSGIFMYSDNGAASGYIGYGNTTASYLASTFHVGTHSSTDLNFVTTDTARWKITSAGQFLPVIDGAYDFGNSTFKPGNVQSRMFNTYTASSHGVQTNAFIADEQVNVYVQAYSGTLASDRGSFQMYRARGTQAVPTAVTNGDRLGVIAWQGYANSSFQAAGVIQAVVSSTVSGSIVPTELQFRNMNASGTLTTNLAILYDGTANFTAGGSFGGPLNLTGSPALRVGGQTAIDASRNFTTHNVAPTTHQTYDLGASGNEYQSLYIKNISASSSIVNTGTFSGSGTVTQNWSPTNANTWDLGSSSTPWNDGFANVWQADTALYVVTSGVTRFSASGGGIITANSSGTVKFQTAGTTGNVTSQGTIDAVSGFLVNGTSGQTATVTVRDAAGTGTCTLIFTGGIKTGGTC